MLQKNCGRALFFLLVIFLSTGTTLVGQVTEPGDQQLFPGGAYSNSVANILQRNENSGIEVWQILLSGVPCSDGFLAKYILQSRGLSSAKWQDVTTVPGQFGGLSQDGLQMSRVVEFRDPRPGNNGRFPEFEWYRLKLVPDSRGDGSCSGFLKDLEHYETSYLVPPGIFKSSVAQQIPIAGPNSGEIAKTGYFSFNLAGPRKMLFMEWKEGTRVGKVFSRSFVYDPRTPITPIFLPDHPELTGERSVYVLDLERGISTNETLRY